MMRKKRGGQGGGGGSRPGAHSEIPVPIPGLGPSPVALAVVPESELDVDYSKIEFLMRGVRCRRHGRMYMGDYYHRDEFYNISVVKNHDGEFEFVAKPWCMSQLSCLGSSSMIHVESRLYNISRRVFTNDIRQLPISLPLPASSNPGETLPCHLGVSWIDVKDPKKWNPGTPHEFYLFNAEFAALGKTIYGLQSGFVSVPYCYRTLDNMWVESHCEPPKEIFKCLVTKTMISQPSKNRILVHLTPSDHSVSYLYSWTPEPQDSWELITQEIGTHLWNEGHANLVDDFIYFYKPMCPPFFSAYDLITKKWVKVNWSANFPPDAAGYKADSMFYLGNRLLCLANSRPIDILDPPCPTSRVWGTRVTFSLFRFHTTSTPVDGPLVIFTHLFTKSLACPDIREVADFISLVQDEVK